MISGANENDLEIANARADVLLSIDDDRQHLLGLIKYWREECFKQDKQLEAYENMRKEAIEYAKNSIDLLKPPSVSTINEEEYAPYIIIHDNYLNILNKVGEDKETRT